VEAYRRLARTAGCFASALAFLLCVSAADAQERDSTRIVPWHKIGDIAMGMQRQSVVYRYGFPDNTTYGDAYTIPGGGSITISYGNKTVHLNDRVIDLQVTAPRYKTAAGIGVGSRIPIGSCHTVGGRCVHEWEGFTLGSDPTVGGPSWQRYDRYGGQKIGVELMIDGGKVYAIHLGVCGVAWACFGKTAPFIR
jgi:hypothetical protein